MRRTIAIAPVALFLCSCYDWSQTREDARHDTHVDANDAPADNGPDHEEDAPTDAPCADPDRDDDGWPDRECGGGDCNDLDPTVWPGAPDNAGRWRVEVVHADAWGLSRIALDGSDRPHFLFYDDTPTGRSLFHHWHDGTDWWIEGVLDRGDLLGTAGLAFDPADDLHAAVTGSGDRDLPADVLHARRNTDGTWSSDAIPVVDPAGVHEAAVVADGRGRVHVAYVEYIRGEDTTLRVATDDSGSWSISDVARRPESGLGFALAVAPDDTLHVVWTSWTDDAGELLHAVRGPDETVWRVETLATSLLAAAPSLAVDAAGHAHLFAASPAGTPYVTDATGDWTFEAVDASGHSADSGAVAVGPDGIPVVAYAVLGWDLTNVVRFARRTAAGWVVEELPDSLGVERDSVSAAVDSAGRAHLLFRRGADIVYALEDPAVVPDGVDQDCDGIDG